MQSRIAVDMAVCTRGSLRNAHADRSETIGRLPSDDEWRQMAKHYGGVLEDSNDSGKATYKALSIGGNAGFNAALGGSRMPDGLYERLAAHGLYWTASETSPATAWLYNFGQGGRALNRHRGGQKQMGASVRCVRE